MKSLKQSLFILFTLLVLTGSSVYSQTPISLWKSYFDGRSSGLNQTDSFWDMAMDNSGNMYVLGRSRGPDGNYDVDVVTYKINTNGTIEWADYIETPGNYYDMPVSIQVDGSGNAYTVANLKLGKIITVKYSPNGTRLWTNVSADAQDVAYSSAITSNGELYILGNGKDASNYKKILLIRYNSNGTQAFRILDYFDDSLKTQRPGKIAIENNGNIVTTGSKKLHSSYNEYVYVRKYTSGGSPIWTYKNIADSSNTGAQLEVQSDLKIHSDNSIYVAGVYNDFTFVSRQKFILMKFGNGGNLIWKNHYDTTYKSFFENIDLDNSGNLYVLASMKPSAYYSNRVVKYNSNGVLQWDERYITMGWSQGASENYLYVSSSGNPYIGGYYYYNYYSCNALMKLSQNGDTLWTKRYTPSQSSCGEQSNGTKIDRHKILEAANGDIIYGGSKKNPQYTDKDCDVFVARNTIDSSVTQIYKRNSLGLNISDNQTTKDTILIDFESYGYEISDVNVIIDTLLHTSTGDLNISLKHEGASDTLIYNVGGSGDNFIETVLDDEASTPISNGSPPFTGSFKPHSPLSVFDGADPTGKWILLVHDAVPGNTGILKEWSLELSFEIPVGINLVSNEIPDKLTLHQNYPNPFNPETKIKFDIPGGNNGYTQEIVKLTVFDLLGREIAVLVKSKLQPGTYEYTFDGSKLSSGIYFYQLKVKDIVDTKKMMLLK